MPVLNIFNESEKDDFNSVPKLNDELRIQYFKLENPDPDISYFRKEELLIGYILLKGYYLVSGRFHSITDFRTEDVNYVTHKFGLKSNSISRDNYSKTSYKRHKDLLCEKYGIIPFKKWKHQFESEANYLVKTALRPKQIVFHLVDILRGKSVEVPNYYVFADTISSSLNKYEDALTSKLNDLLSKEQKDELETILTLPTIAGEPISPSNPYFLTTIKKPEQNEAPKKIKKSLSEFESINDLYRQFADLLQELDISDQLLNYYAVWLIKSKHVSFLAIADPNKKFLYLLSFIVFQFRIRQDLFVDTYLKAVQKFRNEVDKSIARDFLNQKPVRNEQTRKMIQAVRSLNEHFDQMRSLTYSTSWNDSEKILQIKKVFEEWDKSKEDRIREKRLLEKELQNLELSLSSGIKDQMLIDKYISGFRKLNNRIGGIIKVLMFNRDTSNREIIEAIDFIIEDKRISKSRWPLKFMVDKDKKTCLGLETSDAKIYYKVVLFLEISNHIKAGSLNLSNSDKYRAVEEYLISDTEWITDKETLIQRAGLNLENSSNDFIKRMKDELLNQFAKTNENLKSNEHLSISSTGKPKVTTPKIKGNEEDSLLAYLEEENIIPLPRILADVNASSNFLNSFDHFSQKSFQSHPEPHVFYAAIIGLGCNIGLRRMSRVSKGIGFDRLNYLYQWYFSKENLDRASATINNCINQLSLPLLYKKGTQETHTSSDGQKFNVAVPSINASHSYKYFGSGKGVTAYSFIDNFSRLFYNAVISASEREAAYVIDGLMHNENIESDIHSTDTHGYSEIVFAITNGLGVFFAPRIKNYKHQLLYTFRGTKHIFQENEYIIKPTAATYIDEKLISEQWESVLKVITTIKLRRTTASRILKRLSSYSKQHPLYRALKHLGRIYKTIFILKYLDDVNLRQSTEKALNRIEQSHQFAKAIFFGNNQELKQSTQEEQEIAIGARHLIQNVIIFWNYLKISDLLVKAESNDQFQQVVETFKSSSIMTWQHINIHGEYDFDLEKLLDREPVFELKRLLELEVS